jgi:hypothetical protein
MEEQKLRQLFKNRSNCYVDTDDVVQGMDEDCFIETVNEALRIHDVSISLERAKKYARHQHFLGTQGRELVEFEDWVAKD